MYCIHVAVLLLMYLISIYGYPVSYWVAFDTLHANRYSFGFLGSLSRIESLWLCICDLALQFVISWSLILDVPGWGAISLYIVLIWFYTRPYFCRIDIKFYVRHSVLLVVGESISIYIFF